MRAELRVVAALARGQRRSGSHAERLEAFYAPQAQHYDAFRERLLWGRDRLVDRLPAFPGARIVELGAGTGRNVEFFGARLAQFASVELVDLCPSLLERARARTSSAANVRVVEADATRYRPAQPVDVVYFAYSLSMIPAWRLAIDNAIDMLKPGGVLGIVDFYVAPEHGRLAGAFWRYWFAHDGVRLSPQPLAHARAELDEEQFVDARARIPYLPGLRVPVYLFIGRRRR
jgi:S-adenosylmethionine-diacylgycerolhomoserine-N-methlytransferase